MADKAADGSEKRVALEKVNYLAFEGGGGKGITYLGAIQYLEQKELLPINRGKIKGISGSSAGAIVALLLAIGHNFDSLSDILIKADFPKFFENAQAGRIREVKPNKQSPPSYDVIDTKPPSRLDKIIAQPLSIPGASKLALPAELSSIWGDIKKDLSNTSVGQWIKSQFKDPRSTLLEKLSVTPIDYVHCLYSDFGLFSGNEAQTFLNGQLTNKFPKLKEKVTFEDLQREKNINLKITGTNLASGRPYYFSSVTSPRFPVAAAVGLSMSIPLVFKPMLIHSDDKFLRGYWVDGGVANNLPIHLFDEGIDAEIKKSHPKATTLNPGMLGFKLVEGDRPWPFLDDILNKLIDTGDFVAPSALPLGTLFTQLLAALLYPSEEGQIRGQDEAAHVVALHTGSLTTFQFKPDDGEIQNAIDNARKDTDDFFNDKS